MVAPTHRRVTNRFMEVGLMIFSFCFGLRYVFGSSMIDYNALNEMPVALTFKKGSYGLRR